MNLFPKKHLISIGRQRDFLLFVSWFFVVIILSFFHEPWRDEMQAYLLCRDLSLTELWQQNTYEGHLFAWFIFLKVIIAVGCGIASLSVCSITAMAISSFLVAFYAPFSRLTKFVILFSGPFIYIYSIVSRPYALFPCILFIMAVLWQKRLKHPFLFGFLAIILANIHLIFEGMSLCLFLLALWDCFSAWKRKNREQLKNAIIIAFCYVFGVALAFFTIYSCIAEKVEGPSPTGVVVTVSMFISDVFLLQVLGLRLALLPAKSLGEFICLILPSILALFCLFRKSSKAVICVAVLAIVSVAAFFFLPFMIALGAVLAGVFFLLFVFTEQRMLYIKIFSAASIPFLYWFIFSSYIYPTRLPRSLACFVVLIFFSWIFSPQQEKCNGRATEKSLIVFLLFQSFYLLYFIYLEFTMSFSAAYPMAKWINKHISHDIVIAAEGTIPDAFIAVSAVTGRSIIDLTTGKTITFYPRQKNPVKIQHDMPGVLILSPDKNVSNYSQLWGEYKKITSFEKSIVSTETSVLYLRQDLVDDLNL